MLDDAIAIAATTNNFFICYFVCAHAWAEFHGVLWFQ